MQTVIMDAGTALVKDAQCHIKADQYFARIQRSLSLVTNDEGISQCPGLLGNAPLSCEAGHPILLTKDCYLDYSTGTQQC